MIGWIYMGFYRPKRNREASMLSLREEESYCLHDSRKAEKNIGVLKQTVEQSGKNLRDVQQQLADATYNSLKLWMPSALHEKVKVGVNLNAPATIETKIIEQGLSEYEILLEKISENEYFTSCGDNNIYALAKKLEEKFNLPNPLKLGRNENMFLYVNPSEKVMQTMIAYAQSQPNPEFEEFLKLDVK